MARLILEENGTTRRFKLGKGKMTIGSAEEATLTLASEDVAAIHAEIEMGDDGAVLRVRKGVVPAQSGGRPVRGELKLEHGKPVRLGGATLRVEYEDAPRARPARASAAGSRRRATPRSGARGRAAESDDDERIVRRRRPQVQKGAPTWLILLLFGVGIAFVVYFGKGLLTDATGDSFNPAAVETRYKAAMAEGDFIGAGKVLLEFDGRELSPEWKARADELRAKHAKTTGMAVEDEQNLFGGKYLESQVLNFQATRLREPKRPEARVFMQRAEFFLENWPTHPERGRVERLMERYAPVAQMNEPPTAEDLAFEVKALTWAKPRRYKEAFRRIDRFLETASGEERDAILQLKAEKDTEMREHYQEQLTDAAIIYDKETYPDKFQPAAAVEIMVQMVMNMADPELADDAARRLVAMPEATLLESYKRSRPADFEEVTKNAIVHEYAAEQGLFSD